MLLLSPEDMATNSIRQAITALIQANKSLLAQELRLTLQTHTHGTTTTAAAAASVLYPSWFRHGASPPLMSGPLAPFPDGHALRTALCHLCDACMYFDSAGMTAAARACLGFCARVMAERSFRG